MEIFNTNEMWKD